MRLSTNLAPLFLCTSLSMVAACGDDVEEPDNESEVITTITLTFTPEGGADAVSFAFDDADGDGGDPPVIDPIDLTDGVAYAMSVRFENRLEDPPEEITDEVRDESDVHQIFFTGTAVNGPASDVAGAPLTQAYDDEDANGLPVGLSSTIAAAIGTGELTVTLRHMPPVNDVPVKVADLAAEVRDNGIAALPGSTDAQVSFDVTVE